MDAVRIAKYLFKNHTELKLWKPKREVVQQLRALLIVRERLVRGQMQFEVPVKESSEFISKSIRQLAVVNCKATITAIKKDIKKVNVEISKLIKKDAQLHAQVRLATSVTGVGTIIATNMIIDTNEFQDIDNHKKYACYSGIAPFPNQSGKVCEEKTKYHTWLIKELKHCCIWEPGRQFNMPQI